jgi:molybdopterin converting factor small subunit
VSEATITVMLHAHLRHHNGGREELRLPHRPGATVADYIASLAIPGHEYMGVVLDGELTDRLDQVPAPGAVVELVPAVTGG